MILASLEQPGDHEQTRFLPLRTLSLEHTALCKALRRGKTGLRGYKGPMREEVGRGAEAGRTRGPRYREGPDSPHPDLPGDR